MSFPSWPGSHSWSSSNNINSSSNNINSIKSSSYSINSSNNSIDYSSNGTDNSSNMINSSSSSDSINSIVSFSLHTEINRSRGNNAEQVMQSSSVEKCPIVWSQHLAHRPAFQDSKQTEHCGQLNHRPGFQVNEIINIPDNLSHRPGFGQSV